jgi:hypothetical protein
MNEPPLTLALSPLAGIRLDTEPYLRTGLCLPNPSDSGARWKGNAPSPAWAGEGRGEGGASAAPTETRTRQ